MVDGSAQRLVTLANQWEKHRAPLIDQYRELKDLNSKKEVNYIKYQLCDTKLTSIYYVDGCEIPECLSERKTVCINIQLWSYEVLNMV